MLCVLLCDDEPSVTEFLKKNIPWESLGFNRILSAKNGNEALTVFSEVKVDLLITDIRMPGMDGLELLSSVRKKCPDTHCILLTAYGDFEYARTALKLGVDNYLLKPIQISELIDSIENTVDNIYLHRKNQDVLFQENILRRWLSGTISDEELAERTSLIAGINIYQSSYCAVIFGTKSPDISLPAFAVRCLKSIPKSIDYLKVWDNDGQVHFVV